MMIQGRIAKRARKSAAGFHMVFRDSKIAPILENSASFLMLYSGWLSGESNAYDFVRLSASGRRYLYSVSDGFSDQSTCDRRGD